MQRKFAALIAIGFGVLIAAEDTSAYYHAQLGRFVNRDPIGYRGGLNQYAYVENRPTNHVDPFGLQPPFRGLGDDCCTEQFKAMMARAEEVLKTCPLVDKIWDKEDQRLGGIKVVCNKDWPFASSWNGNTMTITIGCNHRKTHNISGIVDLLLFELLNAQQRSTTVTMMKDAEKGKLSCNQFVKRAEEIEYNTTLQHHFIAKDCVEWHGWAAIIDSRGDSANIRPFDRYWEIFRVSEAGMAHIAHYTDYWEENFRDVFCKSHPLHPNCVDDLIRPPFLRVPGS